MVVGGALVALWSAGHGQAPKSELPQGAQERTGASEGSGLSRVDDADPLELGRVVVREGDEAVLQGLGHSDAVQRLAGARAAPLMRAPWLALPSLCDLLEQRDPELAVAAARALVAIGTTLDADTLLRAEIDLEVLRAVHQRLEEIAARPGLRPDLRLMSGQAAAQLADIGASSERPDGGAPLAEPVP